jgi:hypothetical protein
MPPKKRETGAEGLRGEHDLPTLAAGVRGQDLDGAKPHGDAAHLDPAAIVPAFAEFLGADRYEQFLDALRTTCRERNELMWWQKNEWGRFAERHQLAVVATFPCLQRLFRGQRAPVRFPVLPKRLARRASPPRRLRISSSDEEIRALVVEWSELLAAQRFPEALALVDLSSVPWTPDFLEFWLSNYGSDSPSDERFAVTSILDLPDGADATSLITVGRDMDTSPRGLSRVRYLGWVDYDLPLNGTKSDLTVQFRIRRVWKHWMSLELCDIHVL